MERRGLRYRIGDRWRTDPGLQDRFTAVAIFLLGALLIALGFNRLWPDAEWTWVVERLPGSYLRWHLPLLFGGCALMVIKRRHPMFALCAVVPLTVLDVLLGTSAGIILVLMDLLYAAGLYGSRAVHQGVMTASIVVVGTGSIMFGLVTGDVSSLIGVALQWTAICIVPLWWATNVRQQRELGAQAAEHARAGAVHAERSAMARDLHDVVASHLTTTAIQSGATLALSPDHDRDRTALEQIRSSSLAALEEMRAMIVVLRADLEIGNAQDAASLPTLERIEDLLTSRRRGGMDLISDVRLPDQLPIPSSQAAYRIVAEALQNASKHAPGSTAWLEIRHDSSHLTILVSNQLSTPTDQDHLAQTDDRQHGLTGMHERARLVGGDLAAGPERGHWVVRASLPLARTRRPPVASTAADPAG